MDTTMSMMTTEDQTPSPSQWTLPGDRSCSVQRDASRRRQEKVPCPNPWSRMNVIYVQVHCDRPARTNSRFALS